MPFGIFVGIDNHRRTILLGCALLRNKTIKTFHWLFKMFTLLMKKSPKTILTDQDPWSTQAIAKETPFTKHAFCIWHITSKFSGWFTSILRGEYSSWCFEFYVLYKLDTVEEFEHQWPLVIGKYKLNENKNVVGLYKIKEFWVPVYLRDFFFSGMTTTGRSESINAFKKRFISSRICLSQFIKQVDLAIEDVEQKQCMIIYEFGKAFQYLVKEENKPSLRLSITKRVDWISVLVHKDCFEIPSTYWSPQWCRQEVELDESFISHQQESSIVATYLDNFDPPLVDLVHCPPRSIPKGQPKTCRLKPQKELTKQVKHAMKRKKSIECPDKEKSDGFVIARKRATKRKKSIENENLNLIFCLKC
ncbi:FAR1-related sequence 11-like protein [Tanacetum coccineum]